MAFYDVRCDWDKCHEITVHFFEIKVVFKWVIYKNVYKIYFYIMVMEIKKKMDKNIQDNYVKGKQ